MHVQITISKAYCTKILVIMLMCVEYINIKITFMNPMHVNIQSLLDREPSSHSLKAALLGRGNRNHDLSTKCHKLTDEGFSRALKPLRVCHKPFELE